MEKQVVSLPRRNFIWGTAILGAAFLVVPDVALAVPSLEEKQGEADQMRVMVNSLNSELNVKTDNFRAAQDDHDAAVAAMDEAQGKIDDASKKITDYQGKLGTRARSMYRSGNTSFLDLILGATTFEEFVTNWDLLTKMNKDDALLIGATKDLRAEVEVQKVEYAKQETIAAQKLEEARVAKDDAQATYDQYQSTLNSLDADVRELLLAEQQAAVEQEAAEVISQQDEQPTYTDEGGNEDSGSGGGDTGGGSSWTPPTAPADGNVVSYAAQFVGVARYEYGGNGPDAFDCSGFVRYVLSNCGHSTPPRSTYGYPDSGWFPVSQAQPGDVLWQPNHVGICASAGGGSYIHAADETYGICYGSSPQFTRAYRY